jgi:hypothetical protein
VPSDLTASAGSHLRVATQAVNTRAQTTTAHWEPKRRTEDHRQIGQVNALDGLHTPEVERSPWPVHCVDEQHVVDSVKNRTRTERERVSRRLVRGLSVPDLRLKSFIRTMCFPQWSTPVDDVSVMSGAMRSDGGITPCGCEPFGLSAFGDSKNVHAFVRAGYHATETMST